MQVKATNNINFSGVIPVRVLKDGKEVFDKNIVRKTCHNVIDGLAGPLKDKPEFRPIASQLAVMDNDYKYARAYHGYNSIVAEQKLTASKFFKIIYDRVGRGYIVTGKPSENISELGREIGRARSDCKIYGVGTSPRLEAAKKNYWDYVKAVGNNLDLRIKEAFSTTTLQKFGEYQQMDVQITTKPHKVKGKEDTKVILEKISFSDRNQG